MSSTVPLRFRGLSLYEVIGVEKSASSSDIARAYRRAALRYHPDHNQSPTANEEFALLASAHQILTDAARRRRYDQTGDVDADVTDGAEYFHQTFPNITVADIETFRLRYVDSDDEWNDLFAAYQRRPNDVVGVMRSVPYADADNVERLCNKLNERAAADIAAKTIRTVKRIIRRDDTAEATEAEAALAEIQRSAAAAPLLLGGNTTSAPSLSALITAKQAARAAVHDAFVDQLEHKYAPRSKKRRQSAPSAIDEDAFMATQRKVLARAKRRD